MNSSSKITVVIPSNRFSCIKEIFERCILPYKGKLFIFEIHDSSRDYRMENYIKSIDFGYKLIKYCRYPPNISADDKAMTAIEKITTPYFWLMGDGNIVDFNNIEKILITEKFEKYVVVDMESHVRIGHMGQDKKCIINHIYNYTNIPLFAVKYFSHLTYWGAPLIKTDYYHKVYRNGILDKYFSNSIPWWIACTLFDQLAFSSIAKEKIFVGVIYTNFIKSNTKKKDHWWSQDERYYDYTFRKFNLGISLLSSFYTENVKMNIIKNFRKDSLMNGFYLVHLRAIDNLKREMLDKYREDIDIIYGDYAKMYLYHLIPKKVAICLNFIKNKIKPFYLKVKGEKIL